MRVGNLHLVTASIFVAGAFSCRSASESESAGAESGFAGNRVDVTGSITSQSGSQSQMQGWAVVLVERDSGTGRVAEADVSGNLTFSKASLSAVQSVVLLSPDYLVQSVLTLPSTKPKTLRQYFQMSKSTLPRLVQKGGIVSFQTTDGIVMQEQTATDTDADGIPDGVASLGLAAAGGATQLLDAADTDADGIDNSVDYDIDGDGLLNAFDTDDDGDSIVDSIDSDANNDNIADALQQTSDQHFKVGVESVAVQNITTSGGQTLKFVTKVREGVAVKAVKIRGATSFLSGSTYSSPDNTAVSWDLTLADDGLNEDGAAKDFIYARNVSLATGISPRANQMVFFQLTVGEGADQFVAEFPFLFPNLSATVPTTAYDAATRIVTLTGDPFGESLQDFVWSVSVNNSAGVKVYETNLASGATRTQVIPANILVAGQTYTYKATAQLLDKVSSYPSMVVQSDEGTISH